VGVTQLRPADPGIEDLLSRADEALYRAKNAGRNRAMYA
jgi:PleD family two-component response regulator